MLYGRGVSYDVVTGLHVPSVLQIVNLVIFSKRLYVLEISWTIVYTYISRQTFKNLLHENLAKMEDYEVGTSRHFRGFVMHLFTGW